MESTLTAEVSPSNRTNNLEIVGVLALLAIALASKTVWVAGIAVALIVGYGILRFARGARAREEHFRKEDLRQEAAARSKVMEHLDAVLLRLQSGDLETCGEIATHIERELRTGYQWNRELDPANCLLFPQSVTVHGYTVQIPRRNELEGFFAAQARIAMMDTFLAALREGKADAVRTVIEWLSHQRSVSARERTQLETAGRIDDGYRD